MEIKLVRFKEGFICPHCASPHVVLWGKRKNIQRYRCKNCRKLFNDLTGTPLAYTKYLAKWPKMAKALQQSMTVRKTAAYLNVSVTTAFRWRHRLLAGLSNTRNLALLSGIVEMDEAVFRYSQKGSRHLTRKPHKRGNRHHQRGRNQNQVYAVIARDRTTQTRSFVLQRVSGKALLKVVGNSITAGSQLCTNSWRSYQTLANHCNLKHYRLNIAQHQRVIHGIYHIQNVNAYQSRLREWIRRFHGVATKYLFNYLIWFEHLDESRKFQAGLGEQKLFINAFASYPARSFVAA